jgi:hypothetical protein
MAMTKKPLMAWIKRPLLIPPSMDKI